MVLALMSFTVMLLGTCFLAVFGRDVAGLLEKWAREHHRSAAPASSSSR